MVEDQRVEPSGMQAPVCRSRRHAERRKLLASLFERIWEEGGTIIAVKPRAPFARYFTAAEPLRRHQNRGGAESGSDGR